MKDFFQSMESEMAMKNSQTVKIFSTKEHKFIREPIPNLSVERKKKYYDSVLASATVEKKPMEGKWFEVKPLAINQALFQKDRSHISIKQEVTRQYILKAFKMLNNYPEDLSGDFKTMIGVNPCEAFIEITTIMELERQAEYLGNGVASWYEQSLEWAQRIANGESWEDICDKPDTADYNRAVIWEDDMFHFVGSSSRQNVPASWVSALGHWGNEEVLIVVPLIVRYDD